jgi:hypothetical protein
MPAEHPRWYVPDRLSIAAPMTVLPVVDGRNAASDGQALNAAGVGRSGSASYVDSVGDCSDARRDLAAVPPDDPPGVIDRPTD